MPEVKNARFTSEELGKAFERLEALLSTQKARACLEKSESELAFNVEVFLKPVRDDLAECMELVAGLIRERGMLGAELQQWIPRLAEWIEPAMKFAKEIAGSEKSIADRKRKHPDFQMAYKMQILLQKYAEIMYHNNPDSEEYRDAAAKTKMLRTSLEEHTKTKIRIAQRAFEPDMLELAQNYLQLYRHHEKVLALKGKLLNAGRDQAQKTLRTLAKVFEDTEPELADVILSHTNAVMSVGGVPHASGANAAPKNMEEFREALREQNRRIEKIDAQLDESVQKLRELQQFEDAIFDKYGEQLKDKGYTFKKMLKAEKTGTAAGIKKQKASRMVNYRLK